MIERRQIGDATLYLGDCRELLPTFESDSIDFIFTDPPYGHNNNNNGDLIHRREAALGNGPVQSMRPIANDGAEETAELIEWAFPQFARLLPPGACCCCCGGGGGPDPQFARWSLQIDEAFTRGSERGFKQMVVWDKGPIGMGWHYRRSYETVLVAQVPGAACRWYDTTDQIENIIRPGYRGIRKVIPSASDHPTPKPYQLAGHFINLHSQAGDLVLDPFMGGCSTGEAALRLGRRFIGCELDPVHYEASCKRLERLSGQCSLFDAPKAVPVYKTMEMV